MNAAARLVAIAARAAARRIDPDLLGRFTREFGQVGRLPDSPADMGRTHPVPADVVLVEQVRAAVLDLEEGSFLACGGDPTGQWCRLLDAAREGRPGADEELRVHAVGLRGRWPGVIAQLFAGCPGREAIAVAYPPEPEAVPKTVRARRRSR